MVDAADRRVGIIVDGRNSPAELPSGFKTSSRSLRSSVKHPLRSCVLIFTTLFKGAFKWNALKKTRQDVATA